ncbi:MAG: PilZ domain-containing protein [Proteobacteria bacterium]|nr:PilZ domain-containing protein [Pseudomonadota bacterium]MBU1737316.1 PilZ domain-containing protein [Pseudomonadota bacterium]
MTSGNERREAVRATDRILFAFEPVDLARYQDILDDHRRGISIYHQTGLTDIQMYIGAQEALAKLRDRDLELATFLQHLDTKLNMVLQKVSGDKSPFEMMDLLEVDFSASGMAFDSADPASPGEIMALHITLLPDYLYIFCFGEVVSCQDNAEGPGIPGKRVAVKFILINDDDKEKLVQHNFRQQSLALRNRRLKGDR